MSILDPVEIAAGPDGALWFTNYSGSIGRITTAGLVTNFALFGSANPQGITAGPDGALWFTVVDLGTIGRISA
jgi:virginiamycin B lyase